MEPAAADLVFSPTLACWGLAAWCHATLSRGRSHLVTGTRQD